MNEEIFVMADGHEDARRIDRMNGEQARITKRARMETLLAKGIVGEMEMPDTREALRKAVEEERYRRALAEHKEKLERIHSGEEKPETVEYQPKELVVKVDRVEVTSFCEGTLATRGEIKVDGKPLRGVKRLVIDSEAGRLPRVTVELWPVPPEEAKGD